MTALTVSQPASFSGANLVGLPSHPGDAAEHWAAIIVVTTEGHTRVAAVVDLLTHPCGKHLRDDIISTTTARLTAVPATATGQERLVADLSARERDVIQLVTDGLTNKEIAVRLYLSVNTIKTVIRSSYRKIDVERRAQAVNWGLRHGFGTHSDV